jgi:hypothetical protein
MIMNISIKCCQLLLLVIPFNSLAAEGVTSFLLLPHVHDRKQQLQVMPAPTCHRNLSKQLFGSRTSEECAVRVAKIGGKMKI